MTTQNNGRISDKAKLVGRWLLDGLMILAIGCSAWIFALLWNMTVTQQTTTATINALQVRQEKMDNSVSALQIWKAETASNRFTVQNGIKLTEKITELAKIIAAIPKESPQPWFVERVDRMEGRLVDLETERRHSIENP
jgi:hypothetical protein